MRRQYTVHFPARTHPCRILFVRMFRYHQRIHCKKAAGFSFLFHFQKVAISNTFRAISCVSVRESRTSPKVERFLAAWFDHKFECLWAALDNMLLRSPISSAGGHKFWESTWYAHSESPQGTSLSGFFQSRNGMCRFLSATDLGTRWYPHCFGGKFFV